MSQAPGHGREINQKHAKGFPFSEMVSGRSPNVQVKVPMGYREVWWYGISLYQHHSTPQSEGFFGSIFVKNTLLTSKILLVYVRWILQNFLKKIQRLQPNMAGNMQ